MCRLGIVLLRETHIDSSTCSLWSQCVSAVCIWWVSTLLWLLFVSAALPLGLQALHVLYEICKFTSVSIPQLICNQIFTQHLLGLDSSMPSRPIQWHTVLSSAIMLLVWSKNLDNRLYSQYSHMWWTQLIGQVRKRIVDTQLVHRSTYNNVWTSFCILAVCTCMRFLDYLVLLSRVHHIRILCAGCDRTGLLPH